MFRKRKIDLVGVIPEEAWVLLHSDEQEIMLAIGDYMNGRFDHVELESRIASHREDDRECEHRWRHYEKLGVVCRDCGAEAPGVVKERWGE